MKNYIPLLAFVTMLFTSCTKSDDDNKKCGDEDFVRYIAFPTMTPTVFSEYQVAQKFGNTTYATNYGTVGNKSYFGFQYEVTLVCPYEDATIYSTMVLLIANADITDSLFIGERGSGNTSNLVKEGIHPSSGVVYDIDEIFTFIDKDPPAGYLVQTKISFPSQGSFSADSLYFWSQLDSYSMGGQYKTSE